MVQWSFLVKTKGCFRQWCKVKVVMVDRCITCCCRSTIISKFDFKKVVIKKLSPAAFYASLPARDAILARSPVRAGTLLLTQSLARRPYHFLIYVRRHERKSFANNNLQDDFIIHLRKCRYTSIIINNKIENDNVLPLKRVSF